MSERTDEEQLPAKEHAGGDFLAVMLRRKWVVLLFLLMGGGAGWLNYEHTAPVFQARSQVLITRREAGFQSMANGHSDYEDLVSRDILSTQSMVIRSEIVVSQAVKMHKLNTLRSFGSNASIAGTTSAIIGGLAMTKGGDNVSTEDANVLNVSFRGPERADCPKILNAVLDSYQQSLGEDSKEGSQQTLELFRHVSEVLDKQLQQLEGDYNEWRKSAPLIFSGNKEGVNPHYARLTDIESARSKGRLRLSEIRAHVQTIEEALKSGAMREALKLLVERSRGTKTDTKTANANMIEQQLFQLMMEEQLQIENFGSDHPKVKITRKQIQVLQDLLLGSRGGQTQEVSSPVKFLTDYLESQRLEMQELETQDRELSQAYEAEREAAKESLNFEVADESKRAEIARKKQLWEEALERLHQLQVVDDVKDYGGFKTKILAEARDASQVEPVMGRSVAIFGVLGMLLGIALAYMIDLADKSFRTPDEIRGQLRLPVIGHIPVIDNVMSRKDKRKRKQESVKVDEMIACFHRPKSTVSEAYRSIRTAIYFGTRGEEHKLIQVTSADAGDGKTTLVCNLAVSIAQSGKKVCLVDADFRRSRLHEMFGIEQPTGVSSVMAGKCELTDAIYPTAVENLSLLPCGPRPSNPSELLSSERFKELMDVLRTKFDTILIDTPPLLAVTDPSAVAARVDSVLLVMRITKHVRPNALRAKQVLDALGAKVLGVVVNGVDMRVGYGQEGGYRRYGYGAYGYRDHDYGDYYADDGAPEETIAINPPSTITPGAATANPLATNNTPGNDGANPAASA
jgi:capsular exopolysaccharide synthesis family protein